MKVLISFQTLTLPPPFALAYTMELEILTGEIVVDFKMEYLDRESIPEDEILDEGFPLQHIFEWKGTIGHNWVDYLREQLRSVRVQSGYDPGRVSIHLELEADGKTSSGFIEDEDGWEYKLQELIQAIYEKAGWESPLKMIILDGNRKYEISGMFATRQAAVNAKEWSWSQLQEMMRVVYELDFEEMATNTDNQSLYIDPDGSGNYFDIRILHKQWQNIKKRMIDLIHST